MRTFLSRLFIVTLICLMASPAFADRRRDRRDRRDDRREQRQDRRDDRRDHRYDRRDRRVDRRIDRRDHRVRPFRAPPARRVERWAPRRGHVWVNGHWDWRNGDYVWVGGRYERERRGYRWREPRWEMRNGAYVSVAGGWVSLGPTVAPPARRVERWAPRRGFVWVNGHWDWRGGQWAWVPGHYERARAGHRYRERRWESRDGVYISVDGGWVR